MTKKLLPTMIGVILASGVAVAQADVQVFGHIDESINYIDGGEGDAGNLGAAGNHAPYSNDFSPFIAKGDSNTQFVCTDCSIGFKGSEDLGNGLKALFFLDFQYDINNSTGLSGRDQWLGMGGNFGEVKVGSMSTVYKSFGAKLDPVYQTVAQQRNIGLQSTLHSGTGDNGEGRATNSVRYDSPNWNGLKLAATYTVVPDSSTYTDNGYSAGVSYENGGILVFADYISNGSSGDDSAASVGAKYTLNNFAIFGQYEMDKGLITDSRTNTLGQNNTGDGADIWMVGGTYTMGNNMLYVGYGEGSSGSTTDRDGTAYGTSLPGNTVQADAYASYEIVGVHNFSKRTLAYLGYVGVGPDNSVYDDLAHYTLGMKHTF